MESYSFVTTWKVNAKISDVWKLIMDAEEWPEWWKGFINVKVLQDGNECGQGSITHYEAGRFFYSLSFTMKTTAVEKYSFIEGIVAGDLVGTGRWEFSEANGTTVVIYYWNVRTTKDWMNRWAWLLRPIFRLSHNMMMKWGEKGLKRRLKDATLSLKNGQV